jgi:peroxiredoxin
VALVDWDDDGRLDLVLKNRTGPRIQIFHNRYPSPGGFLSIRLEGNGTTSNRDAIGARVTVSAGGRDLRRTLHAGEGFLAQSTKRLHFGLADAEAVDRIEVEWPDGTRSECEGVPAGSRLRIVQDEEGGARVETLEARPTDLAAFEHAPAAPLGGRARRVVLAYPLPLSRVRLPAFEQPERRIEDLAGQPVLINFWQTDCTPCLEEFVEFRREADRLAELDLRIVHVNADDPIDRDAALRRLRSYDFDVSDAGYQDERLHVVLFETLYASLFGPRSNLNAVVPTSFLLDQRGRLLVIYHGPTDVDELEADVRELENDDPRPVLDRLSRGARLVHHERDFEALARSLEERGHADLAAYYRDVDREEQSFLFVGGERRPIGAAGATGPTGAGGPENSGVGEGSED